MFEQNFDLAMIKMKDERTIRSLSQSVHQMGDFERIHALPQSGQEVPDDLDARLVVLGSDYAHSRENSKGTTAAKAILETRGSTPRPRAAFSV